MLLVQKFGGTSVMDADAIRRLITIVRRGRASGGAAAGRGPAVVVSAMSGVTDTLLTLAADAAAGRLEPALEGLTRIRARQADAIAALVTGARAGDVAAFIARQLDQLESVVRGLALLREVTPRTTDAIVATGELISSRLVAAALDEAGIPSEWVDARRVVVTSDEHGQAAPIVDATYAALRDVVLGAIDQGRVPVLGGFIGATPDGLTTTLGRGGSDYSGALVGAGIGADEIQIWTDVDGMLTADPRVVEGPRLVPRLSYAEASELAYFGAKVLHPATILPAVERGIPVRIVNARRPEGQGTLIAESGSGNGPFAGLACKRKLSVVNVTSTRMLMAYGFLRRLFEVFERFRTAVDVVTTSEVSVSVTVEDQRQLDGIRKALEVFADVSIEPDMALVCAVGDGLMAQPEVAARMLRALDGVPLRMVSQAASRRNVTVVLADADVAEAMQRLHREFFEAVQS
ncbi:MAG: lysine-sensitive aspartokinase 3 [Vicinamibacterales bacterium]